MDCPWRNLTKKFKLFNDITCWFLLFGAPVEGYIISLKIKQFWGRGGQVVRMLAFISDDQSPNPAQVYNFNWVKIGWKDNENEWKRGSEWPISIWKQN